MFLFVGGLPRTGTSMLMKCLDNHSQILSMPREVSSLALLHHKKSQKITVEEILKCKEFQLFEEEGIKQLSKNFTYDYSKIFDPDIAHNIFLKN